jgi:hypothetical protein
MIPALVDRGAAAGVGAPEATSGADWDVVRFCHPYPGSGLFHPGGALPGPYLDLRSRPGADEPSAASPRRTSLDGGDVGSPASVWGRIRVRGREVLRRAVRGRSAQPHPARS